MCVPPCMQMYYYFGFENTIRKWFADPDFVKLRATGTDTSEASGHEGHWGKGMLADQIDAAVRAELAGVDHLTDINDHLLSNPNNSYNQLGFDGGQPFLRKKYSMGVFTVT